MKARLWSILLIFPAVVLAQQSNSTTMSDMPGMNHAQPNMIKGSDNPAAIPDATAYRLYFIAIGNPPNPTTQMLARQRAHLVGKMPAMADADRNALVALLDDFKVRFKVMTDAYNAQVDAAVNAGTPLPSVNAFFKLRDQLVMDQRARLKLALTPAGLAQLDATIQQEKRGMSIAAPQGAK